MIARGPQTRIDNLDVLRAAAICMVLVYHVTGLAPVDVPGRSVFAFGKYGVELFFVLSGWLIGGLYWRERSLAGDVAIRRFLMRRWLRTIPPYLVILAISWTAVFIVRHEQFDPRYLFFLQNYEIRIPFFEVSWSLAVEEHFYVALPLVLVVLKPQQSTAIIGILLAAFISSPLWRLGLREQLPSNYTFGYYDTATHLNLSSLAFGVLLSYLSAFQPQTFAKLSRYSAGICILVTPLVVVAWLVAPYVLFDAALTLLFGSALVYFVRRNPISWARYVRPIALASYSTYLTHALVLDAAVIVSRNTLDPGVVYFAIVFPGIPMLAWLTYSAIEKPTVAIRDKYWPRRTDRQQAPQGLERVTV